jgi:hypothetical protein
VLEEQEVLLESFATTHKEERTRAAVVQAICAKSSLREPGRVPHCPQFPVGRFAEVARIWKATVDRRKAFDGDASCSAATVIVISSDKEE